MKVAIITPVFKHSRLVVDPIRSVQKQEFDGEIIHILVNDGCPFSDTHETLLDFSNTYATNIIYRRKPNGGLSSARNYGINFCIDNIPDVDAIYFLDADNSLAPKTISRYASALLSLNAEYAWVYPDIDMIGVPWNSYYGGVYSPYIHSRINICEAGSMISIGLAKVGLRFDETFTKGWEDWEFWLSCAEISNSKASNLRASGFKYRKRPESMLADSERDSGILANQIKSNHPRIFNPQWLVDKEHQHNPRYVFFNGLRTVRIGTDPRDLTTHSYQDFEKLYFSSLAPTCATFCPPIFCFIDPKIYKLLTKLKLINNICFELENILATGDPLAYIDLYSHDEQFVEFHAKSSDEKCLTNSHIARVWAITATIYTEVISDTSLDWFNTIFTKHIEIKKKCILLPASTCNNMLIADPFLASLVPMAVSRMAESRFKAAYLASQDTPNCRNDGLQSYRLRSYLVAREQISCCPVGNYVKASDDRSIGLILPILSFGGVEKVMLKFAKYLRKSGFKCHLFITGVGNGLSSYYYFDCLDEIFESVNSLWDEHFNIWGNSTESYFGTPVPRLKSDSTSTNKVVGLLCTMDVVINFHVADLSSTMGTLRRLGIKTGSSLHVFDESIFSQQIGNPVNAIAFEHCYDFFAPCSYKLATQLASLGVPPNKVIPVPNSSSIEVGELPTHVADILSERIIRQETNPNSPLRLLFLGRLDRQKGIQNLVRLVDTLNSHNRSKYLLTVVGSNLIDSNPALRLNTSEVVTVNTQAAVYKESDLKKLYLDNDILLIPSLYEGLPLTILEAMLFGVVPVCTDVGAISEVIENGINGFCLSPDKYPQLAAEVLDRLACNQQELLGISSSAINSSFDKSWEHSLAPLVNHIQKLLPRDKL
jgi:glycosyltransferase involved in cell wall biosynthesis